MTSCMHKEGGVLESTNSAVYIILIFLSLQELKLMYVDTVFITRPAKLLMQI
jgi:hypothetical protein